MFKGLNVITWELLLCRRNTIAASLANARQHFGSDPAFHSLCAIQLGAKDKRVQAGLVDNGLIWVAAITVTNRYGIPVLFIYVVCQGFPAVGVPKSFAHILGHKPRLTLFVC